MSSVSFLFSGLPLEKASEAGTPAGFSRPVNAGFQAEGNWIFLPVIGVRIQSLLLKQLHSARVVKILGKLVKKLYMETCTNQRIQDF